MGLLGWWMDGWMDGQRGLFFACRHSPLPVYEHFPRPHSWQPRATTPPGYATSVMYHNSSWNGQNLFVRSQPLNAAILFQLAPESCARENAPEKPAPSVGKPHHEFFGVHSRDWTLEAVHDEWR